MNALTRQGVFLCVISCTVALAAEGRITPWIVADAAVSSAFVPAAQWLGFLVAWHLRLRAAGHSAFAPTFARFLEHNQPWLWWWCSIAVVVSVIPPRALGPWVTLMWIGALIPFALGLRDDLRWLRTERGRTLVDARWDVVCQRAVSWGAGIAWFYGIAIWYGLEDRIHVWLRS